MQITINTLLKLVTDTYVCIQHQFEGQTTNSHGDVPGRPPHLGNITRTSITSQGVQVTTNTHLTLVMDIHVSMQRRFEGWTTNSHGDMPGQPPHLGNITRTSITS
jgi:hypothetical protein